MRTASVDSSGPHLLKQPNCCTVHAPLPFGTQLSTMWCNWWAHMWAPGGPPSTSRRWLISVVRRAGAGLLAGVVG